MKAKIRIHRPENIQWGRYHTPWFRYFKTFLEQHFDVECLTYDSREDLGYAHIELACKDNIGLQPTVSDVDTLIENLETGDFVVLSFTEYFNHRNVHYLKSMHCKKILLAHFSYHNIYHWLKADRLLHRIDAVSPWFFGWMEEFDINSCRDYKNQVTEFCTDKMFWKGSGWRGGDAAYRKVVNLLKEKGLVDPDSMNHDQYMKELARHKIALSYYLDLSMYSTPYDHPGEFCYRDMEYMSIGVPFIRIEYRDAVYDGLIPNYHYIAIPRDKAYVEYSKNGDAGVANIIEQKFNEVKNDDDFLKFISKNQLEWFDKYANLPNSLDFTFKLTGINNWIQ